MTGSQLLAAGARILTEAGIPDAGRDARRLLAHALGVSAGRLTLFLPDPVEEARASAFDALIHRRAAREPVSHLMGVRNFYGREFRVTKDVLDPRPETEILIEAALSAPFATVLDLGTGSGCILLTLLAERPAATGLGTDLSQAALDVAASNRSALALEPRAALAQGSWYEALGHAPRFDLIVSNPPYIALDEMPLLTPELTHEPRLALTDEADGLTAYRAIAAGVLRHLAPQGRLMVEIGPTQGAAVSALLRAQGMVDITVIADLDGRDRVVSGRLQRPQAVQSADFRTN
ncbi:peptide chain release factor N(5)-glutamine methyltransferase [Salipiger sp. 1_MG-2023]|uniref:peptide chain release factor N(5)-glutamine methyltransferase n=1 Tax=Salipiger sp. 1_MG-2023 TaxID=3062665 RepID=UPI0026E378C2|nr:peptide chain release factor N(5)-glutamine methyltransferase [Salipiger sp. 1_MG-2023]MDO6586684.1 peptide chain release factor N(5)-glutamine methyltransferase [Salipiger sp. 1_MG-2023]